MNTMRNVHRIVNYAKSFRPRITDMCFDFQNSFFNHTAQTTERSKGLHHLNSVLQVTL